MLKDHSENKDDVSSISKFKLNQMDIYERLEYRFPFYKMDVNGFSQHVKEAMKIYQPDKILLQITSVNLESLQKAFKNYNSWKDLNNKESEFVQFLNEVCPHTSDNPYDQEGINIFNVNKLRLLGILWCDGSPKEKSFEFYDVLQDNQQDYIVATDR